jgi:predicted secreted hydrolase
MGTPTGSLPVGQTPLPLAGPGSQDPTFRPALPSYQYRFPWDHGSHDDFQTEWWYYTGHLLSDDKQRYGYQLTFFRRAIALSSISQNPSRWAIRHIYFAHFAITDEGRDVFRFAEKISREGLGKAGAETGRLAVWIDQWRAKDDNAGHLLHAGEEGQSIDLELVPEKPPVIHGDQGVSRKGDAESEASHYYSFTRMKTVGRLIRDGREIPLTGISWMDHEFGSNQLGAEQVGWDWFSIQLNDLSELMLYQIRRRDGSVEPSSAGTWIKRDGTSIPLRREDVRVEILADWRSPKSGARYPSRWRISIPAIRLVVELTPTVSDQELITRFSTQVTYWEGSVTVKGTRGEQSVSGDGYVELTGYASELRRRL